MRVAMYYNNQDVRIEELPEPKIGRGELKVKVDTEFIDNLRNDIWKMFWIYGISVVSLVLMFLLTYTGLSLKTPVLNISITVLTVLIIWLALVWWIYKRWKGPYG